MKTKILLLCGLILAGISCKKDKQWPYPTCGLISYLNFDDNLKDQKGYVADGIGSADFVTGKIGKALSFNGVNQQLNFIPQIAQSNTHITMSLWVKDVTDDGSKSFMSGNGFQLSSSSISVTFSMATQSANTFAVAGPNSINQWTHVVSTYDGTNMHIYINGAWVASKNNPSSTADFNSSLIFGVDQASYWAGSIDELYIYNRALSQAEVTQLYNMK